MQQVESLQSQEDFVASFAMQRQRLMYHAGTVLSPDAPLDAKPEVVSKLSQMLVAALEVLKVAEQELVEERRITATRKAADQRRMAHQQALFDLAPTALVLTTSDTTLRECSQKACALLGLDQRKLEGKQLIDMVPKAQQAAFREQLAHAIMGRSVAAWSFTLNLTRGLPVVVTASVEVIDDPAIGARALYWQLRPSIV
jgi:PAS domain S-box-containing protein